MGQTRGRKPLHSREEIEAVAREMRERDGRWSSAQEVRDVFKGGALPRIKSILDALEAEEAEALRRELCPPIAEPEPAVPPARDQAPDGLGAGLLDGLLDLARGIAAEGLSKLAADGAALIEAHVEVQVTERVEAAKAALAADADAAIAHALAAVRAETAAHEAALNARFAAVEAGQRTVGAALRDAAACLARAGRATEEGASCAPAPSPLRTGSPSSPIREAEPVGVSNVDRLTHGSVSNGRSAGRSAEASSVRRPWEVGGSGDAAPISAQSRETGSSPSWSPAADALGERPCPVGRSGRGKDASARLARAGRGDLPACTDICEPTPSVPSGEADGAASGGDLLPIGERHRIDRADGPAAPGALSSPGPLPAAVVAPMRGGAPVADSRGARKGAPGWALAADVYASDGRGGIQCIPGPLSETLPTTGAREGRRASHPVPGPSTA